MLAFRESETGICGRLELLTRFLYLDRSLQEHSRHPVDVPFDAAKAMFDVFQLAEFARLATVRQLSSGTRRLPSDREDSHFLRVGFQVGNRTIRIAER
jgi:hypothetical protein